MDRYIGKLLDNRYEILEVIGTGGMAVVYKARCHRLNRLVAIKILREDLAQDAEFRRRFHDESQAVAMLSHPNIMAVYDVSRSSEVEYIVMELIDGITLKQFMQKKGAPLNWKEALHFITQIMKALSHAHSRGIIHRDIKPQNMMVLRDGSVKVADFGIARLASAAQNTLTQEALGSVHYISPEQARGSRIDARSDIYSAGVVLYEMLTGRLPYEGDTPVSVAIQHINSLPLAPREHNPDIPEALEAITLKAMASSVEQRYISAEAMLADLEEFRKNPSINFDYTPADLAGGGADEPTQVIDTGRRRAVQTQTPGSAARRRERQDDYDEEDDMPQRRRKRGREGGGNTALLAVGAILVFVVGIGVLLWLMLSDLFTPTAQEYTVPDLYGQTIEEIQAKKEITSHFTVVDSGTAVPSDTVPAGQVVSQSPAKDVKVKGEGTVITVTLSAGENSLKMPNVTNVEHRQAEQELKNLGLDVIKEFVNNVPVTKDFVISTEPAQGSPVAAGSQVKLVVSLGPEIEQVTVLPMTGQTLEAATKMVKEDLELTLGTVTYIPSTEPKDTVVGQSIGAGNQVAKGTTINLQVSLGPDGDPDVSPSPSPDVSPDVSPSPDVTPSPSPSAPVVAPGASTKSIWVDVSGGDSGEMVKVRVECGGSTVYNESHQRVVQSVKVTVSGTGTQTINIYLNDQLVNSYSVNFDA